MKISLRKSGWVVVLALLLTLTMSITAFAGTITINNSLDGSTYNAYKIFDVTYSGSGTTGGSTYANYSYTISSSSAWYETVVKYITSTGNDSDGVVAPGTVPEGAGTTYKTIPTDGTSYGNGLKLELASDGTTWNVSFSDDSTSGFSAATFAEYLKKNAPVNATVAQSGTGDGNTITLNVTDAGYYFVTSSLGALCMLNTADDSVEINEKNSLPTVSKESTAVNDDTTKKDSAGVGDKISYKIEILVGEGAVADYVLHDIMSDGLTLDTTSIKVQYAKYDSTNSTYGDASNVDTSNYILTTTGINDSNYPKCKMEVTIIQSYLLGLNNYDKIIVTYDATVNSNAITDSKVTNKAYLVDGTVVKDSGSDTELTNYDFDIVKYTSSSGTNTVIADTKGAKFELYTDQDCTDANKVPLIYDSTGGYYRPIESNETATNIIDMSTTAMDGFGKVRGLAAGTYYLKETAAPDGYNLLTSPKEVVITNADNVVTQLESGSTYGTGDSDTTTLKDNETGVLVQNNTGSEIPSTGGMGTTIFYILGGALIVVAGVLLIVRKRTNA